MPASGRQQLREEHFCDIEATPSGRTAPRLSWEPRVPRGFPKRSPFSLDVTWGPRGLPWGYWWLLVLFWVLWCWTRVTAPNKEDVEASLAGSSWGQVIYKIILPYSSSFLLLVFTDSQSSLKGKKKSKKKYHQVCKQIEKNKS